MKTPGVYIVEKNAFPNSIVEVATAVPAFVGYTERADDKGQTLRNRPRRISSLDEFHEYFGAAPQARFVLEERPVMPAAATAPPPGGPAAFKLGDKEFLLTQPAGAAGGRFLLYAGMRQFFQNGGGPCHVVSVGDYTSGLVDAGALTGGIDALVEEREPTMLVVPDCVLLDEPDCIRVQQHMLAHCGRVMRNRVAILDVWGGWKDIKDDPNCIALFRDSLGINYLDFAAAYYPWLHTTVFQDNELDYTNISSLETLRDLLRAELKLPEKQPDVALLKERAQWDAVDGITRPLAQLIDEARAKPVEKGEPKSDSELREAAQFEIKLLNKSLTAMSPTYRALMTELRARVNLLPPSAAMAGVYTMVDNSRGVWKAPANVSINGVTAPAVNLSHTDQEDLNVTPQGKSINAIRSFIGAGVLVWGARTLDGNSLDWRYISVRRTMIMLEESCRLAAKAMVFEPNVANTWVTIKSMIGNFLTGIWKRGGLAGAVPDDAFSVHVGLGETMTPEDILEGILRVTVLVAVSRPAEFIEITFQQQMQKS
jgi:phage tail sheath protein FI